MVVVDLNSLNFFFLIQRQHAPQHFSNIEKDKSQYSSKNLLVTILSMIFIQKRSRVLFKKMLFILKYCSEFEFTSVYVNVTDFLNLKKIVEKILKCKKLDVYIYLFNDGAILEEKDYLNNLEEWTELFILKQNQKKKLENYFEVK